MFVDEENGEFGIFSFFRMVRSYHCSVVIWIWHSIQANEKRRGQRPRIMGLDDSDEFGRNDSGPWHLSLAQKQIDNHLRNKTVCL